MSRPLAEAQELHLVVPGLLHWSVQDERIDYRSDAYAIIGDGGTVLIDPLPLALSALTSLTSARAVNAIVLTAGCHQRAAWELRRRLGAPVWAPRGARALEEEPDRDLTAGIPAPAGLEPLDVTGPTNPHVVLGWTAADGRRALFAGDLLIEAAGGRWVRVPDTHHDDPEATRRSVAVLAAGCWETLCSAHGTPLVEGGVTALAEAAAAV